MKYYLSVPYSVDLTNEKAWDSLNDKNTVFFMSRFHFMIEPVQLNEKHRVGEKIAIFQTPKGASQEQVETVSFNRENIKVVDSIHKSLWEGKHVAKLATQIASKLKIMMLGELSTAIKGELISEFKESFSTSFRVAETSIVRESVTYKIKNSMGPSIDKPIVAVPVYQRCAFDIYFAYIDYILVIYQKKFFGLRKLRKSHPSVVDNKHRNRIRFGVPLARALYWKHLEGSSKLINEDDYEIEVTDPDDVEIVPFDRIVPRVVNFPNVPTLYQIARAAFPQKWKDRKIDNWTEEKLMELEYEEAKGSPWWYRCGPGRISNKKRAQC